MAEHFNAGVANAEAECDDLNQVEGTDRPETLFATQAPDCITTGAGADVIFATFDTIRGDVIRDFAFGDLLLLSGLFVQTQDVSVGDGSALFTIIDAELGETNFTFAGDFADDTFAIISQRGQTAIGLAGPEATRLSEEPDRFFTTDDGPNLVYGGAEDDVILTAGGSDILSGGLGDDVLRGGDGDDFLIGGLGSDGMTGGQGADSFFFSASDFPSEATIDVIKDFTPGEDKILLEGFTLASFSQLTFISGSGGLAIDLALGNIVFLEGVKLDELSTSDVEFSDFETSFGLVSPSLVHRLTDSEDRFVTDEDTTNEIFAGDGDDVLVSGGGSDILLGENGDDVILAGDGADLLRGGEGFDSMEGGRGADVFEFVAGEEAGLAVDVIQDFTAGEDTVRLIGFGLDSDSLEFSTLSNGTLALRLQSDHFIQFLGITDLSQLGDFDTGFAFL